jgi:hypothetical protein
MTKLIRVYLAWPLSARLLTGALATALPFYFAALLGLWVTDISDSTGTMSLGVHAAVFVVLLTLVVFISRYLVYQRDQFEKGDQKRIELKLHAYAQLDRLLTESIRFVGAQLDHDRWKEQLGVTTRDLQAVVNAVYSSFESAYGTAAFIAERVDFEVTFMTESYVDGHITIPAAANRDGRQPRSMILRVNDPNIYDNTITARVYRESRPRPHVIEDTDDPRADYAELYPGQTDRIKSSIVFPVLSDTNSLLGTLVVHCDKCNFFKVDDSKYWTDLLEVFTKRIAVTKKRLDLLHSFQSEVFEARIIPPPF